MTTPRGIQGYIPRLTQPDGVAIAVERRARTAGAVRLAVIPRATTAVLTSFVHASIQPQESTVFTDAWGAYVALRGTFHGVSPKHLQRYLDEFVFRFDRRWRETELFIRVLHRALDSAPCPYHQLTAERVG